MGYVGSADDSANGGTGDASMMVKGGGRFDKQIYVGADDDSSGPTSGAARIVGGMGVVKSVHQASGYSGRLYGGIPGEVRMLDTSSVPNGWRTCDGSTDASYAATDYCYTTHDFRSRLPIGYDTDRDGERSTRGSDTMKGLGGRREFTLAEGDVPSHTHSFTHDHSYSWSHDHTINDHAHTMAHTHDQSHTHTISSHTHTYGAHTHSLPAHTHSVSDHTHTLSHTHNIEHTHDYATDNDHYMTNAETKHVASDWYWSHYQGWSTVNFWQGQTNSNSDNTGSSSISNTGGASEDTTTSNGGQTSGAASSGTNSYTGGTGSSGSDTSSVPSNANSGGASEGTTTSNGGQTTSEASVTSGTTAKNQEQTTTWGQASNNEIKLDPESVTMKFIIK